jgi:DNA-binding transcriptional MerR regulator
MNIEIPDKLYFKIGEVAKMAEVPPHVLRYWESEFSGIKPKRASSKQRLYRRQDVELILKIKMLLHHQGYTIAGARKVLASGQDIGKLSAADQPAPPGERVTDKLSTLKQELIKLQLLLTGKKEN